MAQTAHTRHGSSCPVRVKGVARESSAVRLLGLVHWGVPPSAPVRLLGRLGALQYAYLWSAGLASNLENLSAADLTPPGSCQWGVFLAGGELGPNRTPASAEAAGTHTHTLPAPSSPSPPLPAFAPHPASTHANAHASRPPGAPPPSFPPLSHCSLMLPTSRPA